MSRLLLVCAAFICVNAHAQFTSVDGGAAEVDHSGLMWANTVGTNLSWSGYPSGKGDFDAPGSAQAWVAGLNASHYGGYNDWTLATGVGTIASNTSTNQLGELFSSDCRFSGSSLGSTCGGFSSLNSALRSNMLFLSSSADSHNAAGATEFNGNFNFWVYSDVGGPQLWSDDTAFIQSNGMPLVGRGDALAVREVRAPEIDPGLVTGAGTLLLGCLAVLRGRRVAPTQI